MSKTLFTVTETLDKDGLTYMSVDWNPELFPILDDISPNGELTDKIIDVAEEIMDTLKESEA